MKRFSLLLAALFVMGATVFAQRDVDQKLIQQVIEQLHPKQVRNSIVPERAVYHKNEDAIVSFRDRFVYDEDEYYLVTKETSYQDLGQWYPYARETYEYEFNDDPVDIIYQTWDNEWVNLMKKHCTYEEFGFYSVLKEGTIQRWENGNWVNVRQYVYDYDPIITFIVKEWNGNNWENHYLYTFEYSETEYTVLIQYWQGGAWQNQNREHFTLNANSETESIIFQDWQNGAWQNTEKHEYTYEGNYKLKRITKTPWENGAWSTTQYKLINYTFDGMGNSLTAQCESSSSDLNTDIEMFYNEGNSITYEDVTEVDMFYIDVTAVNETSANPHFTLFPNPAGERFTVEGDDFVKAEVYNLAGQKVAESENPAIDLKNMASGAYMVKIHSTQGHTEVVKLMVK